MQMAKHKSGRRSFRSPVDRFVLFDLLSFSGGVYPPNATSRTISFSISNSFWYYRKRGSVSYIVREVRSVREEDTEKERYLDGSDVVTVALKLAMSLHFPMPKIRAIAVSSHFPLPKDRTFRFSLHTFCLTIVAQKFTLSVAKSSPSLFRLSLEWREPRDEPRDE